MAKARNSFERLASEARQRLDAARDAGEQLSFLADEAGRTAAEVGMGATTGRPKGAMGKGTSQMRKWLADRGYRMPEDVLAEMAGLASGEDAMLTAMRHADLVLTWAYGGSAGGDVASPEQRLSMFAQLYATQLRATDALMPYGVAKAAPDVAVQQNVQVVMPAQPDRARDVTPQQPQIRGRMVPADVSYKTDKKQEVREPGNGGSDSESRTK